MSSLDSTLVTLQRLLLLICPPRAMLLGIIASLGSIGPDCQQPGVSCCYALPNSTQPPSPFRSLPSIEKIKPHACARATVHDFAIHLKPELAVRQLLPASDEMFDRFIN